MAQLTQLLSAAQAGDRSASDALFRLVYDELRKLAASHLRRERPGHTLNPTALVHEAYLRLLGAASQGQVDRGTQDHAPQSVIALCANSTHFFAAMSQAMRRILIESARRKRSQKRGGGFVRRELGDDLPMFREPREDLLALDEALTALAEIDPDKAMLVNLRYFGGLTMSQAAEALGVSLSTVEKWWAYAKAWLHQEMTGRNEQSGVD